MASDFKPLSLINILFKFADDTTFLVPENTGIDISVEFEHFRFWAKVNHMIMNLLKTKEIVFVDHLFAHSYHHVWHELNVWCLLSFLVSHFIVT